MHSDPVSRRAFLARTAGVGIGVALATAGASVSADAAGALLGGANKAVSPLVLATDLHASPNPQRFVFAVARGSRFASFGPAQVAFAAPGATEGTLLDTN